MTNLLYKRIYNYYDGDPADLGRRQTPDHLRRHGLDFADAGEVPNSSYRLDVESQRGTEARVLSISYALGFLAVLTVVHTERDRAARVISFRRASRDEGEAYDDWLENECHEP